MRHNDNESVISSKKIVFLLDIANYTNGLACQKFRPTNEHKLPVIKIKEMHDGFSSETEYVTADMVCLEKITEGWYRDEKFDVK